MRHATCGFILARALPALLVLAGSHQAVAATFSDVTEDAGINYFYDPKPYDQISQLEFQTGGAAAGDYDNDGWIDLYVTRYYAPDVLYRNNGNGTFSDVSQSAFCPLSNPSCALPTRNTNGAGWGDIDNDGDLDMYVSSIAGQLQHFLYINDGAGHFTEEAVVRGAGVGDGVRTTAGTSVSFGDYDNDGWLDIYVGEWRELDDPSIPVQARLLRNLGSVSPGHFEDTTNSAGVNLDRPDGQSTSLTPRFGDLDRDGHQDIAIGADFSRSRMFWNNGDGTFTDGTSSMGVTLGQNDMGFVFGDANGDGRLDWFTTDIFISGLPTDGNRMLLNNGDRTFTDVTTTAGVRNAGWGWGTEMFDYDNDRDLDIIVTNGFHPHGSLDRVRFFENNYDANGPNPPAPTGEGIFTERALPVGITNIAQGRGLLTFDYDKDGDTDVFIVNNHQAPVLYRNNGGNANSWLDIKTVGTVSNAEGVGAFITVTPDLDYPNETLVWEMTGSSTYLAQSEKLAHFGLGAGLQIVDLVEIDWPASGIVQQFTNVATNEVLTVVEPLPDYNSNGIVDAADAVVWRKYFGANVTAGTNGDGTGDGIVDDDDHALWARSFGRLIPVLGGGGGTVGNAAGSIPEPAAFTLLTLAALSLAACPTLRSRQR
jgi:hypothetical protein